MSKHSVVVRAEWDPEARVYVATSEDVPGLVTEAATLPDLVEKLATLVPELLELNHMEHETDGFGEVPMYLLAQHVSKIRVPC